MLVFSCDSELHTPAKAVVQLDTLLVFDMTSKTAQVKNPSTYIPRENDFTRSHIGSMNIIRAQLPTSVPESNLIEFSRFTRLTKASNFANREDYPIRTTVKILMYSSGSAFSCTGQMVSPHLVLTAGHCVVNFHTRLLSHDSIQIVTLFEHGKLLPAGTRSKVSNAYLFKTFIDRTYIKGKGSKDIALLELEEPIGDFLGYVGIGIRSDVKFYKTQLFHKWSYPAIPNPLNPAEVYNGDTLYYNYGLIDTLQLRGLGLPNGIPHGAPGQSGSGYLYAEDAIKFWVAGVYTQMLQHRHFKIEQSEFYSMKEIIDSDLSQQ